MRKIIGIVLIVLPVGVLLIGDIINTVAKFGWIATIVLWVITVIILGMIFGGVCLLVS